MPLARQSCVESEGRNSRMGRPTDNTEKYATAAPPPAAAAGPLIKHLRDDLLVLSHIDND